MPAPSATPQLPVGFSCNLVRGDRGGGEQISTPHSADVLPAAGTSFTILASQVTDTSVIAYQIFGPG